MISKLPIHSSLFSGRTRTGAPLYDSVCRGEHTLAATFLTQRTTFNHQVITDHISLSLILLPRLFPSSGVVGIVINISLSLCTSSAFKPILSISLLHESFHLVFCLPLRLFSGTGASTILLSTGSSSLLLTCPYYFSLFSDWSALLVLITQLVNMIVSSHDKFLH